MLLERLPGRSQSAKFRMVCQHFARYISSIQNSIRRIRIIARDMSPNEIQILQSLAGKKKLIHVSGKLGHVVAGVRRLLHLLSLLRDQTCNARQKLFLFEFHHRGNRDAFSNKSFSSNNRNPSRRLRWQFENPRFALCYPQINLHFCPSDTFINFSYAYLFLSPYTNNSLCAIIVIHGSRGRGSHSMRPTRVMGRGMDYGAARQRQPYLD